MPLPKRTIEPIHVARSVYQQDENQVIELETVTNTTLTNIIRQLSSISKHAEDVFGELARDVGNIGDRANSLQARIDRLAIKVTQLDSTVEEVSLTDIQLKKAFKSAKIFDQQIFQRESMPAPMLETYSQCDKPPPLDKLNVYRDDGKDAIKFYTDPNFFFDLWRQEMLKDTERAIHDKGKKTHRPRQQEGNTSGGSGGGNNSGGNSGGGNNARGHKKRVRPPHNTKEKHRQIAIGHGETIMPNNVIYRTPNSLITDESGYSSMSVYDTRPSRPNSIELRRNYQGEVVDGSTGNGVYGQAQQSQQQQHQHYAPGNNYQMDPNQHHQLQQHQQQLYDEAIYNSQSMYGHTGQGPLSSESLYAPGTPSRTKPRPSQPPPAPPSNGGTPTSNSNCNTPTRGRSLSTTGRDTLPPPPPIPDGMMMQMQQNNMNSTISPPPPPMNGMVAAKLLARTNSSNSRAGSPQLMVSTNVQDANAMVLAQLSSQINNLNSISVHMSQLNHSIHDLPPPPPAPEQSHSPKMSSPNAAPPPPPPPPPLEGQQTPVNNSQMNISKKFLANGDIMHSQQQQANGVLLSGSGHIVSAKKPLPPFHDTRTDLMKAIRDGITLRKVEKSEQSEIIKRNVALNDVASILARRVAIELSESEDSDSEDDSEVWMETNETSA